MARGRTRRSDDVDGRAEQLVLHQRIAAIQADTGKLHEAQQTLREAIARASIPAAPDDPGFRLTLADARLASSHVQRGLGDDRGAFEAASEGLRLYRDAAGDGRSNRGLMGVKKSVRWRCFCTASSSSSTLRRAGCSITTSLRRAEVDGHARRRRLVARPLRSGAASPGRAWASSRQLWRPARPLRHSGPGHALGADFDARTREAWQVALTRVASVMQDGAAAEG